jgi:hypothetical protein
MARAFEVTPRQVTRRNGTMLTPEMSVTITTPFDVATPFYNGAQEIKAAYMRMYGFDYVRANCTQNDFTFRALG